MPDRVAILRRGRPVVTGSPREIIAIGVGLTMVLDSRQARRGYVSMVTRKVPQDEYTVLFTSVSGSTAVAAHRRHHGRADPS